MPIAGIVLAVEALIVAFSLPWLYPRYCSTTEGLSIANLAQLERGLGVISGAPIERLEPFSLPQGAVLRSAEYGLTSADILIENPQPFQAVFNAFYFPGWRAYVDGKQVTIVPTEPFGLISFEVPAGESNLQVRFQDTPLRLVAKALSGLSFLIVLGLVIYGVEVGSWRLEVGYWILDIGRSAGEGRNTEYAIRNTLWVLQGALAVALLLAKAGYIDRHDNWFRRSGFDGARVEGVQAPLEVNFDGEMTLIGYDLRPATVESGETFRLDLYWKAQRRLDTEYSAYARLKDARSNLWSPKDSRRPGGYRDYPATTTWPLDEYAQDSYQIQVLPGTPPGEYDLVVGAFSKATLRELDVLDGQGGAVGASLVVGKLTVVRPRKTPSIKELEIQHSVAIGFRARSETFAQRSETFAQRSETFAQRSETFAQRSETFAQQSETFAQQSETFAQRSETFAQQLELLGYDIDRSAVQAGEGVHLTLFWRSLREMNQPYAVLLQLVDEGGGIASERVFSIASEAYPTTQWQAGEVVRSQHYLPVPAETPAGWHRLQLAVIDRERVPLAAAIGLSELEIEVPERRMTLPTIENPMEINLGDEVTFLGYDLNTTVVKPGDTLRLTLYWQAKRETTGWYKVFTHLLDDENRIWAQKDSVPVGGTRPTTGWVRGEVIVDEYELTIDPDAPGGDYILEVGMYEEGTGLRLRVLNEEGQIVGDRILLGTVRIER